MKLTDLVDGATLYRGCVEDNLDPPITENERYRDLLKVASQRAVELAPQLSADLGIPTRKLEHILFAITGANFAAVDRAIRIATGDSDGASGTKTN
jgi:hypothetical protein